MKTILSIFFLSLSSLVYSENIEVFDEVRSIEPRGESLSVTFWQNSRVFSIPQTHPAVPCLENAHKADQGVRLLLDDDTGVIENCELYEEPAGVRR